MELSKKYPLYDILADNGLQPGTAHTFDTYADAIRVALEGRNPSLQCEYDERQDSIGIAQINICLDKQFKVIDCDRSYGGLNHGCPKKHHNINYAPFSRVEEGVPTGVIVAGK